MKRFFPWLGGFVVGMLFMLTVIWIHRLATLASAVRDEPPIRVVSAQEPHDETQAFALAGMIKPAGAKVIHLHFAAGIDDSMEMVFDLSPEDMEVFWKTTPFADETKQEMAPAVSTEGRVPPLTEGSGPPWNGWKESRQGWYSSAWLPRNRAVQIYVATDQPGGPFRCYLLWNET